MQKLHGKFGLSLWRKTRTSNISPLAGPCNKFRQQADLISVRTVGFMFSEQPWEAFIYQCWELLHAYYSIQKCSCCRTGKYSCSLLPSLSYLDPLEDFCFCFVFMDCVTDLLMKGRGRESERWKQRWSEGGRGKRERGGKREGDRREGVRGGREGVSGRERGRERLGERELCNV